MKHRCRRELGASATPPRRFVPCGESQGGRSSELQEPRVPPAPLPGVQIAGRSVTTASPARTRSTRRRRRLLSAARLCLGPGSYHGVRGVSRAGSGVTPRHGHWRLQSQRLRTLRHRSGEGLRSAARCCPPIPPPGAALAVAPPAGIAGWYSQAPRAGEQGLRIAQRPLGVNPRLCKRSWPCPLPAPEVSGCPGLSQACAPAGGSQRHLPIFGISPTRWTLEGIPGCPPEVAAKPRRLALSLPPSSIHLSGSRAQSPDSPWDQALVQSAQGLPATPCRMGVLRGRSPGIKTTTPPPPPLRASFLSFGALKALALMSPKERQSEPSEGPGSSLTLQEGCHSGDYNVKS